MRVRPAELEAQHDGINEGEGRRELDKYQLGPAAIDGLGELLYKPAWVLDQPRAVRAYPGARRWAHIAPDEDIYGSFSDAEFAEIEFVGSMRVR